MAARHCVQRLAAAQGIVATVLIQVQRALERLAITKRRRAIRQLLSRQHFED